ncbi:MAG TPA: rhomboid family intramembrane serine protease [Polyangiaceae bacterium]
MPPNDGPMMALPLPGKAVRGVMLAVFVIWLSFAIGLNWGSVPGGLFLLLAGSTDAILHGEVWRLFTAPLLHDAQGAAGVSHIITTLLGLFFLAPRLEEQWGSKRMLRFIALSALVAYALQMLVDMLLPASLSERLVGQYWFGLTPALGAIAIAWALTFKNQVVRLFFVIPVTSRMLVVWVVGLGLLYLVAGARPSEGLIAPFGGMLCGWLLGGGTPSPLRRAWLKLRLAQLDSEAQREGRRRKPRPNPSGLRVIPGGRADDDEDKGKGPDGRWLN